MSTRLIIEDEEFSLACPACHHVFEDIVIHREYEFNVECPECTQTTPLNVGFEAAL